MPWKETCPMDEDWMAPMPFSVRAPALAAMDGGRGQCVFLT